jgi:hypothetical protein
MHFSCAPAILSPSAVDAGAVKFAASVGYHHFDYLTAHRCTATRRKLAKTSMKLSAPASRATGFGSPPSCGTICMCRGMRPAAAAKRSTIGTLTIWIFFWPTGPSPTIIRQAATLVRARFILKVLGCQRRTGTVNVLLARCPGALRQQPGRLGIPRFNRECLAELLGRIAVARVAHQQ